MRKLDLEKFLEWLSKRKSGLAELSILTGIGFYTLRRIAQGKREPKQVEQIAIVQATGLSLDELFPVLQAEK
jgi:transcriptional regulator with XRE-family HTH domain